MSRVLKDPADITTFSLAILDYTIVAVGVALVDAVAVPSVDAVLVALGDAFESKGFHPSVLMLLNIRFKTTVLHSGPAFEHKI